MTTSLKISKELWERGIQVLPDEQWKWVKGYEGRYAISDKGRVYSSYRQGSIMRQYKHDKRYYSVQLFKDNNKVTRPVHRLVAEAFVSNPNNYPETNHLDGDKENNCAKNLEWCTRSQNAKHAYEIGLMCKQGEKNDMYGKKHSEETKAKISEKRKLYHLKRRLGIIKSQY